MARLVDRLSWGGSQARSLPQWWVDAMTMDSFSYNGLSYISNRQTYGAGTEDPAFYGGCAPYTSNGVGFAVVQRRAQLFSQARFKYKRFGGGVRPMAGDLFTSSALAPLDNPISLLSWMEVDVATAGNAYVVRDGDKFRRLNPFWCSIVGTSARYPDQAATAWDAEPQGLVYLPAGRPADEAEVFLWDEVAHYAPIQDPDMRWRGMSYLRPVVTEVRNMNAYNTFVSKYWQNNATPNMVVVFPPEKLLTEIQAFRDKFLEKHQGVDRAFRTAFLGGGADVKMVGANLADLGSKDISSDAFSKVCAAAGVPPVVVTIVPGLESASTYANYQTAMRAFADLTVRPLWLHATFALAKLLPAPADAELWYDVSGVSALQQDAMDDAQVMATNVQSIRSLGDGGWDKVSARDAVLSGDLSKLKDTGLNSVQLIPPGAGEPKALPATNGAGK